MGQKLFKKLGNKFTLTYAGQRYVAKATEILNIKKELDQEMNDIVRSNVGVLKVAFPVMRGTYMLPLSLIHISADGLLVADKGHSSVLHQGNLIAQVQYLFLQHSLQAEMAGGDQFKCTFQSSFLTLSLQADLPDNFPVQGQNRKHSVLQQRVGGRIPALGNGHGAGVEYLYTPPVLCGDLLGLQQVGVAVNQRVPVR